MVRASERLRRSYPARVVRWWKNWLLINGSRRRIAIGLLVLVYATIFAFHVVWPVEITTVLDEERTIKDLLGTLLSGDILLISIVVSINSLVVSQELTPIGDQHNRVIESWDFREQSESVIGDVSPATPAEFLRQVCEFIETELAALRADLDDMDSESEAEIRPFVEQMEAYVDDVQDMLREAKEGWFRPALFAPAYDPAEELDDARQIRQTLADSADERSPSFENLINALQYLATAREYFKTIYYKREFSRLSRDLLYTGLPAILVISYVLLAMDAGTFPGTTLGVSNLFLFFGFAYTLALSPFLVLTGYVLRAAIVAENTMITGGFFLE